MEWLINKEIACNSYCTMYINTGGGNAVHIKIFKKKQSFCWWKKFCCCVLNSQLTYFAGKNTEINFWAKTVSTFRQAAAGSSWTNSGESCCWINIFISISHKMQIRCLIFILDFYFRLTMKIQTFTTLLYIKVNIIFNSFLSHRFIVSFLRVLKLNWNCL